MGAEGVGSFENDDAMDFVSDLEESGWKPIGQALKSAERRGYLEAPAAARAIAAAEVIAATLGHPPSSIPRIEIHGATPKLSQVLQLKDRALRSLNRIRTASELAELWKDAGDSEAWELTLDDVEARLALQPQRISATPKPDRTRLIEGSWFAIPLPSGGFAVGVLSQLLADKLPFGYFFGPRLPEAPEKSALANLNPSDAIVRSKFGATEIDKGRWLLLGVLEGWRPESWPTPPHTSGDSGIGMVWRVEYPRNAPKGHSATIQSVPAAVASGLGADIVMGALALEKQLDRLL